jgi:hypothetical protein
MFLLRLIEFTVGLGFQTIMISDLVIFDIEKLALMGRKFRKCGSLEGGV